ncbi:MAG: uroporphyrinogen-III C-methyltransferase [Phycisphaerales bacterium]|nr:uroporphyrinogen-III C-methyltransferase [Phycisphaerales bacterium]MCB9862412.1 uroporphyrinogen-III C-methyltransferase [Phycisphaerales bacterium]
MSAEKRIGRVYLVGAGPGDPDLITLRGLKLLRAADVVLFDRLTATELLATAGSAELIDVGKAPGLHRMSQHEINALIVTHALSGKVVVRLKGGDPLTFGRGMEELEACREHGIPCEVVPGVSSVHAVPAAAGIPLTHRGIARSYAVITGQTQDGNLPDHDFAALARIDTLVVLMGLARLGEITDGLLSAGRALSTPAAVIASGTTPRQRTITGTLATIADIASAANLESPAIAVIGDVAVFAKSNVDAAQTSAHAPLAGRRVVVTQAESTSTNLQRLLAEQGATVINVPLIQISYPTPATQTREALAALTCGTYDAIAFTSVHGVRGFGHALKSSKVPLDAIRHVPVAALGHGTAEEASKLGLHVSMIPDRALADELVVAIDRAMPTRAENEIPRHVLFPKSNRALPTLPEGLTQCGFRVTDPIVYETNEVEARDVDLAALRDGFDAILFCSPSAVQRFDALDVGIGDALVGCIGPTTAREAIRLGLNVDVTPDPPGSRSLVQALVSHFENLETISCQR